MHAGPSKCRQHVYCIIVHFMGQGTAYQCQFACSRLLVYHFQIALGLHAKKVFFTSFSATLNLCWIVNRADVLSWAAACASLPAGNALELASAPSGTSTATEPDINISSLGEEELRKELIKVSRCSSKDSKLFTL